jgi:hypothetical protein
MATYTATGVELLVDGRPVQGSFTQHQEWIDATAEYEPDPNWTFVDSNGHEHRWMAGPFDPLVPLTRPQQQTAVVPTLVKVDDDEPHWCEDCQGDYQPWHYECRVCGDRVSPRTRHAMGRNYIPGMRHFEVEVEDVLRMGSTVQVTVPTDPPQVFEGRVVSGSSGSDRRSLSQIVQTGAPRPVSD